MPLLFRTILKLTGLHSAGQSAPARPCQSRESRLKSHPFSLLRARSVLLSGFALCLAFFGCVAYASQRFTLQTVSVSPSTVNLGSVAVGKSASASISVVNSKSTPITVSKVGVTGQSFSIAGQNALPVSIPAGGSHNFNVSFGPLVVGLATGQVAITTSASTSATVVNLTGTGAAAQTPPALTGFSCSSATMTGTGAELCTAMISAPAPAAGFRVGLSSDNAAVPVSSAALVHANTTSVQFTANVTPVKTAQKATLSANAGSVTQSFTVQLDVPVPTLSISVASVAFGSVSENTPATQVITLSSTGTGPVTISAAAVTGADFSMTSGTFPLTLNAGQTTSLTVQYDPTVLGAETGQLTVSSNSSTNPTATIPLSGSGLPVLSGFTCASASMGGTGTDLCTLTLSGPAPAAGLRIAISSNNAAVATTTAALVHANTTSVQFTANVTPVTTAQTAILTANAGPVTKTFTVQLTVPVPTLSISVASVAFGSVSDNSPATQTVTLSSTGTAPVTVSAATVTGADFSMTQGAFPVTLNPGQSATIILQYDPTVLGVETGQLTVSSNSSTNPTATIPLSGSGLPILSAFTCASASMGGTGTDVCTVTLSGPAPAAGLRVGISSNNAAVTTTTAAFVQPNTSSTQFTLNVTAVSTAQTAILTACAGPVTDTFTLQLNAALPTLGIGAASVAFGDVPVNVTTTRMVTLTSTGLATVTVSGATVTGTGFTMAPTTFPIPLSPGQSATISIQLAPTAAGVATGQLTIASNSTTGSTATVSLSGTGSSTGAFSYSGSPLVTTFIPPNPTAAIPASYFGMTIHHSATPFPAFPISTLRFWDVVAWADIEATSGQFDWSRLDTAIPAAQASGVTDFIFTFGKVPVWASANPTDPCTGGEGVGSCGAPNMPAFDAFATQMVQRYCGKIKYYETWNEANSSAYWDGTNAQLLAVAQDLYSIAKNPVNCGCTNGVCAPNGGTNPNQVIMPSISRVTAANLSWLSSYMSGAGAQYPYADVASFHGYGDTNPEQIASDVQSLDVTLGNYGLAGLPLWNTEASWGVFTSVDQDQAAWLMRYHVVQAAVGVSRFTWYAYDNCGWGTLWEAPWCANPQMPTSQVTAPGQAYGVIESWLTGATLTGCQEYVNGLWACELQRANGYDGWMVWSSTGTDITVPVPETFGLALYRDWQNNLNALPSQVTVGETPVLLENYDL